MQLAKGCSFFAIKLIIFSYNQSINEKKMRLIVVREKHMSFNYLSFLMI